MFLSRQIAGEEREILPDQRNGGEGGGESAGMRQSQVSDVRPHRHRPIMPDREPIPADRR